MSINIHDPKLARLFRLAEQRELDYQLDLEPCERVLAAWVDSYSDPERNHYVKIEGEEVTCHCRAAQEDKACTHAAVCVAHYYPSIWLGWLAAESAEFLNLRHKILANARLTLSEKRKVARNVRAVNEELFAEAVV